jgi:hypothetical protein
VLLLDEGGARESLRRGGDWVLAGGEGSGGGGRVR